MSDDINRVRELRAKLSLKISIEKYSNKKAMSYSWLFYCLSPLVKTMHVSARLTYELAFFNGSRLLTV